MLEELMSYFPKEFAYQDDRLSVVYELMPIKADDKHFYLTYKLKEYILEDE